MYNQVYGGILVVNHPFQFACPINPIINVQVCTSGNPIQTSNLHSIHELRQSNQVFTYFLIQYYDLIFHFQRNDPCIKHTKQEIPQKIVRRHAQRLAVSKENQFHRNPTLHRASLERYNPILETPTCRFPTIVPQESRTYLRIWKVP